MMNTPRLTLDIKKLRELKTRELQQKKLIEYEVHLRVIQQISFNKKMRVLSLTPRPSKTQQRSDDLTATPLEFKLAPKMQNNLPPTIAIDLLKPTPQVTPQPEMVRQAIQRQQALKVQLNILSTNHRAHTVRNQINQEKIALQHVVEKKTAAFEQMNKMGM